MAKEISEIEKIMKRRGLFWQSSEIYGGLSGFYDYGHLGTAMKKRWENIWRRFFLGLDDNFFEIEPTNIMHEKVFVASGHVDSFVDPIVKCKKCGNVERADQILEEELKENFEGVSHEKLSELLKKHKIKCRKCKGHLEDVGALNMLFPLDVGADNPQKAYLRGETAQGVYINFRREFDSLRKKLPMGLAIIGRAYRNEISPRNLLLRMREFSQAELQIFFNPEKIDEHEKFKEIEKYELILLPVSERKANKEIRILCKDAVKKYEIPKFYVYYMAKIQQFYLDVLKIPKDKFRFRELDKEERAFYNKYHWDIELNIDKWTEVAGCHYRTDHDLSGHQKISKQDMSVFVDEKKVLPHVLELSFGVDRNLFALFVLGFREEKDRTIFEFPRKLAPYDCAVFPLVNKDGMDKKAEEVKEMLTKMNFDAFYDDSGSIGRRYRRMDEIGVSCCITIDGETKNDETVTIRDRDSMKQVRVKIDNLCEALNNFLNGTELDKLGKAI